MGLLIKLFTKFWLLLSSLTHIKLERGILPLSLQKKRREEKNMFKKQTFRLEEKSHGPLVNGTADLLTVSLQEKEKLT